MLILWGLTGLALVSLHWYLAALSIPFDPDQGNSHKPIRLVTGLLLAAGAVYLVAVYLARKQSINLNLVLLWILFIGASLRISAFYSVPVLEDDFYRYLWDGAVTASGYNPYGWSPNDVMHGIANEPPAGLRQLAQESGKFVERINHPNLRTVYPPLAQGAFTLPYLIRPWSLGAWRLVLMMFDVATLILLFLLLRSLKMSPLWIVVYWWCPLVVKEVYNTMHMDLMLAPLVLGALWLAVRGRLMWGVTLLALAAGAKIWPVILLPIFLRPLIKQPGRLLMGLLLFLITSQALMLPVYLTGLGDESGFAEYAKRWEMNDALFMLILWWTEWLFSAVDDPSLQEMLVQRGSRALAAGLLGLCVLILVWRPAKDPAAWAEKCLLAVAALFLLSPTQFPWYYLWVMPLLVLRPRASLILLAALLPLYYLRFHYRNIGDVGTFDNRIVWIEYVPVWCLLIFEFIRDAYRQKRMAAEAIDTDV